jgi:hypothetical protein
MAIDFTPQFHRKVSHSAGACVWVAIPHPRTLMPVKTIYHRVWQQEEHLRLQRAGETVLAIGSH